MKQGVLMMLLVSAIIGICGCAGEPTETTGGTFTVEYDHQTNWDCFGWGIQRPSTAFEEAGTVLELVSDDTLENARIRLSDRLVYHNTHRGWLEPGNPVYPYYLCGIEAFTYDNGVVIDSIAGWTYHQTTNPRWSFVCGWVAWAWNSRDKAAIHELGHQTADLTHLCLNESQMNPLHDAEDCVMGQRDTAVCTGKCLANCPQFCPACRVRLTEVR